MSDDPTDESDPFDDLEDGVPDGDPFDDLQVDDDPFDDLQVDDDPFDDPRADDDPFDDSPFEREGPERVDVDEMPDTPAGDPFADLGEAIGEDPFASGDWDASGTDESVWEDLSTEPEIDTEEEGGRRVSSVDKHSFCEQCRYVTDPPEFACTHEGTEIRSFPDMDTVRVVDCPIVEERERLERGGFQE
ncbi:MAG: hypothetical protein ACOCPX_05955 [Halapricum sp.]